MMPSQSVIMILGMSMSKQRIFSLLSSLPGSGLVRQHQALPRFVRVYWLTPLSFLLIFVMGMTLTLPPGPLCDEGMVLFMEGGCDWGASNIFFFFKLGLLVTVTFGFVMYSRNPEAAPVAFLPHFLLATYLVSIYCGDTSCDTYYSHPNGNLGQMTLEVSSLAILGIVIAKTLWTRNWPVIVAFAVVLNAFNVAVFYFWLRNYDHWLWEHTFAICYTLLGLGCVIGFLHLSFRLLRQ